MNSDGLPSFRAVSQVSADRIVHAEPPPFLQYHDGNRRELFRHRSKAKLGLQRIWNIMLKICHSVGASEQNLSIPSKQNDTTESFCTLQCLHVCRGLDTKIF